MKIEIQSEPPPLVPVAAPVDKPEPTALTPLSELTDEVKKEFINGVIAQSDALTTIGDPDIYAWGPWSSSKLKCLQKCPFQYYLRYILKAKIPAHWQIQTDPTSANVGKAAHQILEYVLVGKTVDAAYKKTKEDYLRDKLLTEEVWAEKVDILYYNINNFKERIEAFAKRNPIKRVLTELRIAITKDYEPTGFFSDDVWLRGVVDLVIMLECNDAIVFDHKTGGGLGGVKYYTAQLDWYKVLFHFGINRVNGVQTGVHFIAAGDVSMDVYSPANAIENNLKNSLEMSLEGAIDKLKDLGYFKHIRGGQCKWCDYDQVGCKSGELKAMELGTKKWFEIKPVK